MREVLEGFLFGSAERVPVAAEVIVGVTVEGMETRGEQEAMGLLPEVPEGGVLELRKALAKG